MMRKPRAPALPLTATAAGQRRFLRATPPKLVGPLIAGIGVAAMAYGAKVLIQAAQSGEAQEAMKKAAEGIKSAASGAASAASAAASSAANSAASAASAASASTATPKKSPGGRRRKQPQQQEQQQQRADMDSYFTTDVMGVELGDGAKAWSGATAAIFENDAARVVENEQGARSTPSVVAFTDGGEVVVGQPAKKLLFSTRATTVSLHSLLLGVEFSSDDCAALRDGGAFEDLEVAASADGGAGGDAAVIRVHNVAHRPEELSGRVLASLKESAESALGNRSVLSAVLGAPVLASQGTRAALVAAGKRAGLSKVTLLDAAVSGACAAALELPEIEQCTTLGVYALNGRSFSFSILERGGGGEEHPGWDVRGARRQALLGGENFDVAVVEHLVSSFLEEHGIDLRHDHLALQRLHEAAEGAKLELCKEKEASISLPFITADASGPKHLEKTLSRSRFDALCEPTLSMSTPLCDGALDEAGVAKSDLHAVLIIGGSARLSAVERHVSDLFPGLPTLRTARPEEAVALGAAMHAQRLQALEYAR